MGDHTVSYILVLEALNSKLNSLEIYIIICFLYPCFERRYVLRWFVCPNKFVLQLSLELKITDKINRFLLYSTFIFYQGAQGM